MSDAVPAGWYADPKSRHEYRYWDGSRWTEHVADRGKLTLDPVWGDQRTDVAPRVGSDIAPSEGSDVAPKAERRKESPGFLERRRQKKAAEKQKRQRAAANWVYERALEDYLIDTGIDPIRTLPQRQRTHCIACQIPDQRGTRPPVSPPAHRPPGGAGQLPSRRCQFGRARRVCISVVRSGSLHWGERRHLRPVRRGAGHGLLRGLDSGPPSPATGRLLDRARGLATVADPEHRRWQAAVLSR